MTAIGLPYEYTSFTHFQVFHIYLIDFHQIKRCLSGLFTVKNDWPLVKGFDENINK